MTPRRMPAVGVLLSALLLPALLEAQPCPPGSLGAVPNFSLTKASDGNITLRWDPVTGTAGIVPQYEVVEQRSADPCGVFGPQNVIATTTATTFTFKPSQSNSFYLYSVRLAQDRCKATRFSLLAETFTTLPAKPAILSAVAGPASVVVTFSYSDLEADGQTVTVKATLRSQILIPGGLASAPLSATREYTLAPRQSIVIQDLARAIFGTGRDTLGDIQEMQLEVAVTGGEGGVVAYTLATENATDDTAMRME